MKRTLGILLVLAGLGIGPVFAAVVDAGNAMCPVSGDKVSGKDFVEHGDKKYGICCAMCAGKFEKNPEKYLAETSEAHEGHPHGM